MALPTAYLTSRKRLPDMLDALKTAQAPDTFTQKFLEILEFKSKGDRLIISVLKSLGFLEDSGKPKERYFEYLDQTQSERVLAEGIREAYADLFAINTKAYELPKAELVGKLKTLSQGQYSAAVLGHMADTFLSLVKLADFKSGKISTTKPKKKTSPPHTEDTTQDNAAVDANTDGKLAFGGLVYNIQIVLPDTRDQAVYDALFKSLRQHLK